MQCMCIACVCVYVAGTVRVWGREMVARRQRQLQASSEPSGVMTSDSNHSNQVGHSSSSSSDLLSLSLPHQSEPSGQWTVVEGSGEHTQTLEGATSASSLASEQLEESLSAASLPEVGSDWQLAVDSLTSSMDSSVSMQPPSLPTGQPPPQSSSDQQAGSEDQVTGESQVMQRVMCCYGHLSIQALFQLRSSSRPTTFHCGVLSPVQLLSLPCSPSLSRRALYYMYVFGSFILNS